MKRLFAGLFGFLLALIPVTRALAVDSTTVVHPLDMATSFADVGSDPSKWFFYNDESDSIDNTLGSFVSGPDTAPLGDGSVQISVSGSQRRNLATYQFSGTKLSDITELKFSTYNPSAGNGGSVDRSAYLNFNVTFDGVDSWQKRLAYVPSKNGAVSQDSWQEWDAIDGGSAMWWWSGFAANGNKWPDNNTSEYRTWSDLTSAFPNIAIRTTDSWLGLRVGEPYADGYTENLDKFVLGTADGVKTFDFDPVIRSAEITAPTAGEHVAGLVDFDAYLHDDDVDAVQWAVRAGTCAAGTGTVFGNVDGHSDVAAMDTSNVLNQTFHFQGDMTDMDNGDYCFVYNPVEDSGESNIRLTREFVLADQDHDGVVDDSDNCPEVANADQNANACQAPTNKDDCKDEGWKSFTSNNFRNQGECVSYVNHHDGHGADDEHASEHHGKPSEETLESYRHEALGLLRAALAKLHNKHNH